MNIHIRHVFDPLSMIKILIHSIINTRVFRTQITIKYSLKYGLKTVYLRIFF